MIESIESLTALQKIDTKINRLTSSAENIEKEISKRKKTAVEAQKEYDLILEELENVRKEKKQKERDVEVKEGELTKYKKQLLDVKTNREYEAMISEIATVETSIGLIEEDIIRIMEKGDDLDEQAREKKALVEEEKKKLGKELGEKQKEFSLLEGEIKTRKAERSEITKNLERSHLGEYEKLIRSRQGIALVTAKNGVCGGCFMALRPQLFENIKKNDKVHHCPSCHRFLYWDLNR